MAKKCFWEKFWVFLFTKSQITKVQATNISKKITSSKEVTFPVVEVWCSDLWSAFYSAFFFLFFFSPFSQLLWPVFSFIQYKVLFLARYSALPVTTSTFWRFRYIVSVFSSYQTEHICSQQHIFLGRTAWLHSSELTSTGPAGTLAISMEPWKRYGMRAVVWFSSVFVCSGRICDTGACGNRVI